MLQDKNILSYMSPNEPSPGRTHSIMGWISLACPVLVTGSCIMPVGPMSRHSGVLVLTGLVILGIIVSVVALFEASIHKRRRAIPRATLFFYLVFLWFVAAMVKM